MSDALTDIYRDQKRAEILREIEKKEREFYKSPSRELAEKLIELWKRYSDIGGGYWTSSNLEMAYAKIGFYLHFIETGIAPIRVFPEPLSERDTWIAWRAIGGHGQWMGIDLDDMLCLIARRKYDRDDTLKVKVDKEGNLIITPLTCHTCPEMFSKLGCRIPEYCKGNDVEARKERLRLYKELQDKGRSIEDQKVR